MQSEPAKERIGFFARTAFQNRDSCIQKPLRSRALSIWQGSFAIWNEKSSNKSANKCLVLAHLLAETRKSSNESTNKCSVFANLFDDFFAFVSAIPKNSCLARKIHDFRPSFRRLPRARSVSAIVRNVRAVKGPPTYFWKAVSHHIGRCQPKAPVIGSSRSSEARAGRACCRARRGMGRGYEEERVKKLPHAPAVQEDWREA